MLLVIDVSFICLSWLAVSTRSPIGLIITEVIVFECSGINSRTFVSNVENFLSPNSPKICDLVGAGWATKSMDEIGQCENALQSDDSILVARWNFPLSSQGCTSTSMPTGLILPASSVSARPGSARRLIIDCIL